MTILNSRILVPNTTICETVKRFTLIVTKTTKEDETIMSKQIVVNNMLMIASSPLKNK
jgi:hypothetical protein